ncbi:MAG: methyltransferase domain-containing protein [Campylobacterales bacterium]
MILPFLEGVEEYDRWFEDYREIYNFELEMVRKWLPTGRVLEVGVGTGRFAVPLGIGEGVEPARSVGEVARRRGVKVWEMRGEEMEFEGEFDGILMVTTICFLDNPEETLRRCWRGLKRGGVILVGFVDRESPLGQFYFKNREKSRFYRYARFFSQGEVEELIKKAGFQNLECREGLYGERLEKLELKEGPCTSSGAFKLLRAFKL